MREIGWGFIGCGEVTEKKSGQAFNLVSGSHIEAVTSLHPEHAKAYAEKHGIPKSYVDAQSLINDPRVDAVYISTPPSSHSTYAIMAMRAGKPVYVEKPLAVSYMDCVRINRVSRLTGVPCYVAYYRRYLPYFQRVKQIIREGQIGKVMNVLVRFSCPPRPEDTAEPDKLPWRLKPEISGGGYFYDMAPHTLDLLQDMFGVIIRAHGYCANLAGLYGPEDNVDAVFKFESGLNGTGSWCFVGHESAEEDRVEIIGTKGMVSFSMFNYEPIHLHVGDGVHVLNIENPPYVQLPIIKNVIEAIQGTGACSSTSESATLTNWVMDRILGKN